jgi:hypothetical protein
MYNSLSNIQKHLYSLIKQNNPEYLQQSINEEGAGRSTRPNLAQGEERPADFEGLGDDQAKELRQRNLAGKAIREKPKPSSEDTGKKDKATRAYYDNALRDLPTDPKDYTEKQAADLAMMRVIYKTKNATNNAIRGQGNFDDKFKDTAHISDDALAERSVTKNKFNEPTPTQATVALRYQKKAKENALDLENRPISPFYKTTRKEFKDKFGRDFDASGGSTPSNMRALLDIKNNVGGQSTNTKTGLQGTQSQNTGSVADKNSMLSVVRSQIEAERQRDNNSNDMQSSSNIGIDITQQSPDQIAAMNDPSRGGQSGRFGKPKQREMDTWGQGSLPNNSGGMQNANQAMDLTGKSVNSKVSRIA